MYSLPNLFVSVMLGWADLTLNIPCKHKIDKFYLMVTMTVVLIIF